MDLVAFGGGNGEVGFEPPAVDVRITGFWRWKNVIVPPNAYVVHTRRGREEPVHIGLGTSFRFNPITDSYLVVPAAMQTIVINANSICREKQGILVQGYVQWVIDDFETAYRRLDFGDPIDPMRVVNVQLREQAEAVIKDTVATMSLENVLADRQPIIKELTSRLRTLMEGEGEHEGLGLRIVTVQIKEAVVSSPTVWESLQRPYRAERAKEARLAELGHAAIVRDREAGERKAAEQLRMETEAELARIRADNEARAFDRQQAEAARRARVEAEALAESIEHEKEKAARRAELATQTIEIDNAAAQLRFDADNRRALAQIETDAAHRRVVNDLSDERLREILIEALPAIVERMPKPDELKSVQINGADGIGTLLPALVELVDSLRRPSNGA
jgi:regulator of protease activity HflC (stomatin/prohibitin superfamily)